ncbi:MAG: hypothetical protein HY711_10450 [Candidatus Melainabacteria bacterium]|nr:hypothetical protein [Candidatus Melainabacteria bacterium]
MVTHDIPEALALAEKIVVLDRGTVQQIGTSHELLHQPCTATVANFIGQKNVFLGTVTASSRGIVTVETASGSFRGKKASWIADDIEVGQEVAYVIDLAKIKTGSTGENELIATIESRFILGSLTIIRAIAPGVGSVCCQVYNGDALVSIMTNDDIKLVWSTADAFVMPTVTCRRPVPTCRSNAASSTDRHV